jgi:hypothetical protein
MRTFVRRLYKSGLIIAGFGEKSMEMIPMTFPPKATLILRRYTVPSAYFYGKFCKLRINM